jgi:NADP-reducing hydrogenase subunit HndD
MENTLKLNGQDVAFEPGQTLLQVATAAGVEIPTLCFVKDAVAHGACRICVVEVEGHDELLPACETLAAAGLVVQTDTDRVRQTRAGILEMLVASPSNGYNSRAPFADGGTEAGTRLQALLADYGVAAQDAPAGKDFPLDDDHHLIRRDFSRCIQCGRCVAACHEVQVNQAIPHPFGRRAGRTLPTGWYPAADYDACTYCGECVQVCPTGALQDKKAGENIDPDQPVETVRTTCAYCGVGCQLNLHVQGGKVVKATGVEDAIPNRGRLCVKGRFGYDFIHADDRLTSPLIKDGDRFREASWDEALTLVAEKLAALRDEHGGDCLAGLTSARVSNEENYLMQRLVRAGFGTNNIDHCARL